VEMQKKNKLIINGRTVKIRKKKPQGEKALNPSTNNNLIRIKLIDINHTA